jgi:FMN phosphatase YigB (HAD superfamily)
MGIRAVFFDMDDTLVLTGEADVRAYREVMHLAKQRKKQVQHLYRLAQDTIARSHWLEGILLHCRVIRLMPTPSSEPGRSAS